jgi:hypothetical protein
MSVRIDCKPETQSQDRFGEPLIHQWTQAACTDVRLGLDYQAQLPSVHPRPLDAGVPEDESQYGGRLVLAADTVRKQPRRASSTDAAVFRKQHAAVHVPADAALALGLGSMGAVVADTLTVEQQQRLLRGMQEHGRDFLAITRDFLPDVAPAKLAAYYYDVWKLRAVPAAKEWYRARNARAMAREAAESKREEAIKQRRVQAVGLTNRRRQVKDVIRWVRCVGKTPRKAGVNNQKVRERAGRTMAVLHQLPLILPSVRRLGDTEAQAAKNSIGLLCGYPKVRHSRGNVPLHAKGKLVP